MRIRSIKPTNEFVYVDFGAIKDNWQQSAIYTPSGFADVKAFELVKRGPVKILSLSNGMRLECDPCHQLLTCSGPKFAKDLKNSDQLVGVDGPVDFDMCDGPDEDLYDIQIDSPHWYYTSGVVSHNSLMLVNNAVANVKRGKNVLYVTLEMADLAVAVRALGVVTNRPTKKRIELKDEILRLVSQLKARGGLGDLVLHELPPDETSVDTIHALIDNLKRTKGWIPDVVCIDYLELMVSRRGSDNQDDYTRQKGIATQVRGLAQAENILVFTATQTNRSGNDASISSPIGITKLAESYGKSMPIDYLFSINQTPDEYNEQYQGQVSVRPAPARIYVVKNRTGNRGVSIPLKINYNTFRITEEQP